MLDVEPQKRPTAAQILAHSWMTSQTPSSTQLVVGTKVQDVKVCRNYYVLISFPVFLSSFLFFWYTTILSWWYRSIHDLNFSFRAFKILKYVSTTLYTDQKIILSYPIPKLYRVTGCRQKFAIFYLQDDFSWWKISLILPKMIFFNT